MLVLSRKPKQSVIVDGPCRITVLDSKCKLGFEGIAKVRREELPPSRTNHSSSEPIVYLVDDDTDLLTAYGRYLSRTGFELQPFSHGGDFLEKVRGESVASAAVIDLRLTDEDIDGLRILQQLRAWHHDYPIILLTGYGDIDTCRRAFHGGCYTFLQKPVAPDDLAVMLKEAVTRYHQGVTAFYQSLNALAT